MPVLFVSHSSKDDAAAGALGAWLVANGFDDLFLDHDAIAPGAKWREALRMSAGACRVVLCLVTENWLASNECYSEFRAAWYMGKRTIPLFLLSAERELDAEAKKLLAEVSAEDQGIDLSVCRDAAGSLAFDACQEVADRLRAGLRAAGAISRVGLDPQAFTADPKLRPTPFPGLTSFGDDDADAAVLYGRSREIAEILEELRKMRAERDLRPLVILGASGTGKSSLLKAGIIPRLRHQPPVWLPLRAFRPGADPLLNFAEALSRTLADYRNPEAHGAIHDRLFDAWSGAERTENELTESGRAALESAIEQEGQKIRDAAGRKSACILVSIDQAEEITWSDGASSRALTDYLRAVRAAGKTEWQLAFTTRTDSFPEVQRHRLFNGLEARGFDLRAMPPFRFDTVIEEPAKRYGVEFEPALVDTLMEAASKEDALPLLAFTLQRLWHRYGNAQKLTKEAYEKFGGLNGLIEDAAERALRGISPEQDTPLPDSPVAKEVVDLAAATFVPSLVQLNELGNPLRHQAKWDSFSSEQRELLVRFDRWRLIVRKGELDGATVEVGHEALFREWGRLKHWLEAERAELAALRLLQADAAAWDASNRDTAFLNLRGERLKVAERLARSERYRKRMGDVASSYIVACRQAERETLTRSRWVKGLVAALVAIIILGAGAFQFRQSLRDNYYWVTEVRPYVLAAARERELQPRETFKECANCPEMVVVPEGRFTMGGPVDGQGDKREYPRHDVTVERPFAVAKFEVTFEQWDACAANADCNPNVTASGWDRGQQPVINVSWRDAKTYVAWLSQVTGRTYRLLSEAEWEYAARANSPNHFTFGGDEVTLKRFGWYADNADHRPHPVGKLAPNAFGLHDMHGNVREWVEDCSQDSYQRVFPTAEAWVVERCPRRVVRGGSWLQRARSLRSASRDWMGVDGRADDLGFRVARDLRR